MKNKKPRVDDPTEPRARETLAEFVKRVRVQDRKISLKEVERRSGGEISRGYISQIENGFEINPSPRKLRALADGLSVSLDELLSKISGAGPRDDADFRESVLHRLHEKSKAASPETKRFIDRTIKH